MRLFHALQSLLDKSVKVVHPERLDTEREAGSLGRRLVTRAADLGATALHLQALDSKFVVTFRSAREAAVVRQQWSRLITAEMAEPSEIAIDLRSTPPGQHGRALLSQVTIHAIEAAAGTRLMLHAAGIADDDGRVLALVGPSGMGKTTASIYLSGHGFGYVTDETVSIGPDGDVLPFGRPLSLRQRGGEKQISPDNLGLGLPAGDLRIERIVLLDRVPARADPPSLTPVPLIDALLELIPQASALAKLPEPLQLMCRVIDRCGGLLRLTYGQMDERVLSLFSELLGREIGAGDPWRALLPKRRSSSHLASAQFASVEDEELFQGSVTDGVTTQGDALVLVDHVPVRLGEIGLTIWNAARDGVAPAKIVAIVEQEHGAHPDGPRIVREAVGQMLEAGVLVAGADQLAMAATTSP